MPGAGDSLTVPQRARSLQVTVVGLVAGAEGSSSLRPLPPPPAVVPAPLVEEAPQGGRRQVTHPSRGSPTPPFLLYLHK